MDMSGEFKQPQMFQSPCMIDETLFVFKCFKHDKIGKEFLLNYESIGLDEFRKEIIISFK